MTTPEVPTRYFSFGFGHAHAMCGKTFDKDCLVKITAPDPRAVMTQMFGREWSMEYRPEDLTPDLLEWFPRGVIDLA
jgi:hypothetical protein